MRVSNKNKQKIYYSFLGEKTPKYEKNPDGSIKYVTVDGESVPIDSGDYEEKYTTPVSTFVNIAFSGGETTAVDYGTDISKYDATILMSQSAPRLTENVLIWYQSTIKWEDEEQTIPDEKSADYRVTKVTPSLNEVKYLLERIQK